MEGLEAVKTIFPLVDTSRTAQDAKERDDEKDGKAKGDRMSRSLTRRETKRERNDTCITVSAERH